jgi:hypothetical protein
MSIEEPRPPKFPGLADFSGALRARIREGVIDAVHQIVTGETDDAKVADIRRVLFGEDAP